MQEDPPGPRKAPGLPSAPDRGGPPGDVTLAPAPAGPAPPAPACFGGLAGPPPFLGMSSLASSARWPSRSQKPGQPWVRSAEAESVPAHSGNGFRSAPAVQAAGSRVLPWVASYPLLCPEQPRVCGGGGACRQGSPTQTAFPHQPPSLETSLTSEPWGRSPRLSSQNSAGSML